MIQGIEKDDRAGNVFATGTSKIVEDVVDAIHEAKFGGMKATKETVAIAAIRATLEHYRDNVSEGVAVSGCQYDDPLGGLVDWRGDNTTTREAVIGVFKAMISQALLELDKGE